jgi:hypothetical protein
MAAADDMLKVASDKFQARGLFTSSAPPALNPLRLLLLLLLLLPPAPPHRLLRTCAPPTLNPLLLLLLLLLPPSCVRVSIHPQGKSEVML